jgi:hypothetical protein
MELNEIDILAFTVFRNLEQINDSQESRLARQCLGKQAEARESAEEAVGLAPWDRGKDSWRAFSREPVKRTRL